MSSSSSSSSSTSLPSYLYPTEDGKIYDFTDIKVIQGPSFSDNESAEFASRIRSEILNGQVPIEITISEQDCSIRGLVREPHPYYIMAPRHGYFSVSDDNSSSLLFDVVKKYLESFSVYPFIPNQSEVFFDDMRTGQRLSDDLPIGILYDVYCSNIRREQDDSVNSDAEDEESVVWKVIIGSPNNNFFSNTGQRQVRRVNERSPFPANYRFWQSFKQAYALLRTGLDLKNYNKAHINTHKCSKEIKKNLWKWINTNSTMDIIALLKANLDAKLAPIYHEHSNDQIIEALKDEEKMKKLVNAVRIPLKIVKKLKDPIENGTGLEIIRTFAYPISVNGYSIKSVDEATQGETKILSRVKYRWPTLKEFLTLYFDDEILNGHNIYMQGIDLRVSQAIYETSIFDIWGLYMHPDLYVYIALV